MFQVEKKFTGGLLKGMVLSEQTSVKWEVGQEVKKPIGGSPYVIIAIAEVN